MGKCDWSVVWNNGTLNSKLYTEFKVTNWQEMIENGWRDAATLNL